MLHCKSALSRVVLSTFKLEFRAFLSLALESFRIVSIM